MKNCSMILSNSILVATIMNILSACECRSVPHVQCGNPNTCEQAVHYHLKPCCIGVVAPDFVPSNVTIPADVQPLLTPVHKEYLRLMFSMQVL